MEIKDFKMVVTPEQSVIVQEFLFKNGYSWGNGIIYIWHYKYLVFRANTKKLIYATAEEFEDSTEPELTFEQFQKLYMQEAKQDNVNHPNHYTNYPIEVIDMMISIFGKEDVAKYCLMQDWLQNGFRCGGLSTEEIYDKFINDPDENI